MVFQLPYRILARHGGVLVDESQTGSAQVAARWAQALLDEGNDEVVVLVEGAPVTDLPGWIARHAALTR
jgi:hypothetical protein